MLHVFYSDLYTIPLPPGHKFPMEKYRALREALLGDHDFTFEPSPLATRHDVELAHDAGYVDRFLTGRLTDFEIRRIGFPWSEALVKRTLASAGGTLAAAKQALKDGCSGALAGGTHHAFYAEGSGFCVFNDIAIAALWLREARQIQRAAVIDLDVHQGDGTAALFEDDPDVWTFSMHCEKNFPLRKQISKRDVGLPAGLGDVEYLQILGDELPSVFSFNPKIVFYQAGVDGLKTDRLGHLCLSAEGLRTRDEMVFSLCQRQEVPVVISIGGGYSEPIAHSVLAHASTFRTAASVFEKL